MSYQKNGGDSRAASLSADRRKEIAQKAALARWDDNLKEVTHRGSLSVGNIIIPCAVLDDGTRVISENGMTIALGSSTGLSGYAKRKRAKIVSEGLVPLPTFLSQNLIQPYVNQVFHDTAPSAIKYRDGANIVYGYDAIMLPKVCEVWLRARDAGVLLDTQAQKAIQAEAIMRSLAQIGIVALVDEATGYQGVRAKDALQRLLQKYLNKELSAWVKRFPDEFYEQMYRLKGWEWSGMSKNRFSCVGRYTTDVIYDRLAPELIEEMRRLNPMDNDGQRKGRHHQLLTEDTGIPALSQHFHLVLTLMRASSSWDDFKLSLDKFVPKKNANMLLDL